MPKPADSLTVFVPTRLVNPTNERVHWTARAKRAKAQRDAVAVAVFFALRNARITAKPSTPKTIEFVAHVARRFDTDGLVAALKSVRDGLQDCRLIDTDGPSSGHTFAYGQLVKKPLGVTITVRLT